MASRFQELENKILVLEHTYDEWQALRKEFDALVASATEDELQEFTDSGAGEALFMATSAPA